QYTKDIKQKIASLNNNETSEEDFVTAKNGEKVLRISKNGRRYLIFDNMSFTAPTKEAIVKPKYDATYKFKANDKQRTVHAQKNKTTVLGEFIPGDYVIESKKEMANGQFSGELKFNFNNSNHETVDVSEDFNEAYIVLDLKGASEIDKDTVKVKVKEKTIKRDKKKDKKYVIINFDSNEIQEYVDKKEKEENSFRNKVARFFGNYTAAMNNAHSQSNFNLVSSYLKKNTDNYKSIKNNV